MGLGQFLELETVIADESHQAQAAARESLLRLAHSLNLSASERRSYLRLLIEKESTSSI